MFEDFELEKKHYAIGLSFILIAGIAIATQASVAGIWTTKTMTMGEADCSVTLGVVGMDGEEEATVPVVNNPVYLDGVEITSVKFVISIIATGENVVWNTLEIRFTITSEGHQASTLQTWVFSDFSLTEDGDYEASGEYVVDEFIDMISDTEPDSTLEDGTDIFILDVQAEVDGSIKDLKENIITASVTIVTNFELNTAPDGTFSLKSG